MTVPTLFVHSDDAAFPDKLRHLHSVLAGPKDLFWMQGSRIDFYGLDPYVATADSNSSMR